MLKGFVYTSFRMQSVRKETQLHLSNAGERVINKAHVVHNKISGAASILQ